MSDYYLVLILYLYEMLNLNDSYALFPVLKSCYTSEFYFSHLHWIWSYIVVKYVEWGHNLSFPNRFAVGAEVDEERINLLLSNVKGKDITELIASGREKLASVPSGGGAAVAVAAGGGGGGAAAPAPAEAKKEEKVEEKEESDDVSFLRFLELHFKQLKFLHLNIL